jgi:hypothetical protein
MRHFVWHGLGWQALGPALVWPCGGLGNEACMDCLGNEMWVTYWSADRTEDAIDGRLGATDGELEVVEG